MSLLYLLVCIVVILVILGLAFFLLPGVFGIAEQTSFEPSNYENLVSIR